MVNLNPFSLLFGQQPPANSAAPKSKLIVPPLYPYVEAQLTPIPLITVGVPAPAEHAAASPETPPLSVSTPPIYMQAQNSSTAGCVAGSNPLLAPFMGNCNSTPTLDIQFPLVTFLLCLIPFLPHVRHHIRRYRRELKTQDTVIHPPQRAVDAAFRTNSWTALYALIRLTHERRWTNSPLWYHKDVQAAWHTQKRRWMKGLLSLGIIPLYIQKGGLGTEAHDPPESGVDEGFTLFDKLARKLGLKIWMRAHKRAYFEFLVPFPADSPDRVEFFEALIGAQGSDPGNVNQREALKEFGCGVTVRFHPPPPGASRASSGRQTGLYFSKINPPEPVSLPLVVGTISWFKCLLPFKLERPIMPGYGVKMFALTDYIQDWDLSRVPLLRDSEYALVRVESRHFGEVELDGFVYLLARESGMERIWAERQDMEEALDELERGGWVGARE